MAGAFAPGSLTAYGAGTTTLDEAVRPLEMAAAVAGVPLAGVDADRRAAAVIVADAACRLGRCRLETAHRARRGIRHLLSAALYLLSDRAGSDASTGAASPGRGSIDRHAWEEYFQHAGTWCQDVGAQPGRVLRLVAAAASDTGDDHELAVIGEAAGDVGDNWGT